jgi:hypothetical protein
MEFQNIDSNMDLYITKFKDFSFIMKNADLQKGKSNKVKASSSQQTTTPQTSIPQSTKSISIPQTTKSKS